MSDTGRTTVEAIEETFAAAVGRLEDVRTALDHEPDLSQNLALPAVTMLWTDFGQDNTTTGPATDNQWGWDVNVYVPLEIGWANAQKMLKRIVAAVLAVVREESRPNEQAVWLTITDGGPPVFVKGDQTGYLHKTLRLVARTEER